MRYTILKKILFVLLCCCSLQSYSQLILSPQLPSSGLLQKDQLWNVLVMNNPVRYDNAILTLVLEDERTQQKILTGTSRSFTLMSGTQQLKLSDVGPVQYTGLGNSSLNDRSGLLPVGRFIVYYTLETNVPGKSIPLGEAYLPLEVQPLSPPQLISPLDTSVIDTKYPNFNWMPPSSVNMFGNLTYSLLLVEVRKKQNPYDAIQRNPTLLKQDNITAPLFNYPTSLNALEEGKTYAWQVVVTNNSSYTEKTEVWSFSVAKKDTPKTVIDYSGYPKLKRGYTSEYYTMKAPVEFTYFNDAGDASLLVKIYNTADEGKAPVIEKKVLLSPGTNYINLQVPERKFMDGSTYLLEAVNGAKQSWYLKFKYVKNKETE